MPDESYLLGSRILDRAVILLTVMLTTAAAGGLGLYATGYRPPAADAPSPAAAAGEADSPKTAAAAPPPEPAGPEVSPTLEENLERIQTLRRAVDLYAAIELARAAQEAFPRAKRRLETLLEDLRRERYGAGQVEHRLEQLGASDESLVRDAREAFRQAGAGGALVLRRALRRRADAVAIQAAEILAREGDPQAPPLVARQLTRDHAPPQRARLVRALERLRGEIPATLLPTLYRLGLFTLEPPLAGRVLLLARERLQALAGEAPAQGDLLELLLAAGRKVRRRAADDLAAATDALPAATLRRLYAAVREDQTFRHRHLAGILLTALRERAEGEAGPFGTLLEDADAFAVLEAYVGRAIDSEDPEIAAWGTGYGGLFGLYVRGLRGQYFHGTDFQKLVHQQRDATISVKNRAFPYPDGRQDEISVRWEGQVRAPRAGTYTFHSASDDGQRLWIDGELIIDDWTHHAVQEKSATVELTAGWHDLRHEFFQGGGGAEVHLRWSGPGIERQIIPPDHFRTLPWAETAAEAE
jgi:hypothetical protein